MYPSGMKRRYHRNESSKRTDAVRYNYAWKLAAEMRKQLTSRELML